MKGKYLLRGIGGLALSALLVFGVAASSATQASARGGWHGGGGGGFHGGGGFRGGGFHSRVVISPRFRFGYPYWSTYPYAYPYGDYGHYVFGDSVAANSEGYQDGLKTGADDAQHGRSFDPERSHYFKDAGFGNFAEQYREGFERGYGVGFGR